MSASYKLKRLSFWQWRKVLREVVAVVSAAEKCRSQWEMRAELADALDVLDEKLGA